MNIYFIYRKSQKNLGSVKMRVFQLKDMIASKNIDVKIKGIHSSKISLYHYYWLAFIKRSSILIFNKDAIDRAPIKMLSLLRSKNIKVALDVLDKDLNRFNYNKIDYLIASSNRQYEYLKNVVRSSNLQIEVLYIPHQADLRLKKIGTKPTFYRRKNKKVFYFGEHTNLYCPTEYLGEINIIPYNGIMADEEIQEIRNYNFQYCIRGPQQNTSLYIFKPITKIINSYYLSSLPIISFDMDDAVKVLGADYPFTLQSYSDEGFRSLFECINNPTDADIKKAKESMKKLNEHCGFDAVTDYFTTAIRTIGKQN